MERSAILEELEKLGRLHEKGLLPLEEFEQEKAVLLSKLRGIGYAPPHQEERLVSGGQKSFQRVVVLRRLRGALCCNMAGMLLQRALRGGGSQASLRQVR